LRHDVNEGARKNRADALIFTRRASMRESGIPRAVPGIRKRRVGGAENPPRNRASGTSAAAEVPATRRSEKRRNLPTPLRRPQGGSSRCRERVLEAKTATEIGGPSGFRVSRRPTTIEQAARIETITRPRRQGNPWKPVRQHARRSTRRCFGPVTRLQLRSRALL